MQTAPTMLPEGEDLNLFDNIIYSNPEAILADQDKVHDLLMSLIDSIRENYYDLDTAADKERVARLRKLSKIPGIKWPENFLYYADELSPTS